MKTPASYQIARDRFGQRIALGDRGHGPVKGRVERCDLLEFWIGLGEGPYGVDLERLMGGLDLFEPFKLRDHLCVDQHRLRVARAALQDPVTHGGDLEVLLVGLEPGDDELDRAFLVERMRLVPIMGVDRLARGILRDKARLSSRSLRPGRGKPDPGTWRRRNGKRRT